jgi:predicted phosphodiesterase
MRVAILADIHGNPIALDAVLADIARRGRGVDAYWILGDIVALGYDPVAVLDRLAALPGLRCIRGNTERYVCTGDRPPPSLEQAEADPALLPVLVEVAGTFAWTQGAVTQAGWLDWLSALPMEYRTALPDGTTVLCVHAAPGRDDGVGFYPALDEAERAQTLGHCDADLLCVGHTHQPMDALVDGTQVVNPGSVSNPLSSDLRACYALLEATPSGYRVAHHRVDYDREEAIAILERLRHPGASFVIRHLQGRDVPSPRDPKGLRGA